MSHDSHIQYLMYFTLFLFNGPDFALDNLKPHWPRLMSQIIDLKCFNQFTEFLKTVVINKCLDIDNWLANAK